MEGMNNELLTFLQHLREFGLVYLRKRSSGRFYPTRLALNITAGQNKVNFGSNVKLLTRGLARGSGVLEGLLIVVKIH